MSKANGGRYTVVPNDVAISRFAEISTVLRDHMDLICWCVRYASSHRREAVSLRDIPQDIFDLLTVSDQAKVEAASILYLASLPQMDSTGMTDLEETLVMATTAMNLEALRRAGEIELRDTGSLFDPKAEIWIRGAPGSAFEALVKAEQKEIRGNGMKICARCQVDKRREDYHQRPDSPDGKNTICKDCRNKSDRERHRQHTASNGAGGKGAR